MRSTIVMIVAVALGGALSGCGGGQGPSGAANPPPTGNSPPPAGPPTDFVGYVTQQVNQPNLAIYSAPVATSALTNDLQLGSATAFSPVFFGTGDRLPAGVNQAAVACGQAGKSACNPAVSADLNSTLN